jgi:hypothetical protein
MHVIVTYVSNTRGNASDSNISTCKSYIILGNECKRLRCTMQEVLFNVGKLTKVTEIDDWKRYCIMLEKS